MLDDRISPGDPLWLGCLEAVLTLAAIIIFGTAFWWFVLVVAAPPGGW